MEALTKLNLLAQGQVVICSSEELEFLDKFDPRRVIRSRPAYKQGKGGLFKLDAHWECWIECLDLQRIKL